MTSAARIPVKHSPPAPAATPRGLLTLADVPAPALRALVERSAALHTDPGQHERPLGERMIGLLFMRTSTRTRTAFSVAAARLGGTPFAYGPADLQTNTGESVQDTGRVLGAMLDVLVVRTAGPLAEMRELSRSAALPVVNAMAAEEHPTQAVCDLATLRLRLGALDGLRLLYVGEGNNTATALAHALARTPGTHTTFATPRGYGLPAEVLRAAATVASAHGGTVLETHDMTELPAEVDVVYTTRWQTTGSSKPDARWREAFRPFHVDEQLMQRWPDAHFLHDLPAQRGEEVSTAVLDGPRSLAWTQAGMKLASAMAVLEDLAPHLGRR